jgi:hypothetical protein
MGEQIGETILRHGVFIISHISNIYGIISMTT